jgi:hypothetical protein
LLTGLGHRAVVGMPNEIGRVLITLGSCAVAHRADRGCGIVARDDDRRALLWLLGNLLWLSGRSTSEAAVWWIGFLVLTIVGERLELARVRSSAARHWSRISRHRVPPGWPSRCGISDRREG